MLPKTNAIDMAYLTLAEVKKHLNIDDSFTDDDAYLVSVIDVAEAVVQRDLDTSITVAEGEELPAPLKQAMLLIVGNFYKYRESVQGYSTSEVPMSVRWLLDLYHDYAIHGI